MSRNQDELPDSPREPNDDLIARLLAAVSTSSPDHPIWSDERFLEWLSANGRVDGADLEAKGREALARASCRQFHVLRLLGAPTIVALGATHQERVAPLVDSSDLASGRDACSKQAVVIPDELAAKEYVAFRLDPPADDLAPFAHPGDTVLLSRDVSESSHHQGIVARSARLSLAPAVGAESVIGILVAVWCAHGQF